MSQQDRTQATPPRKTSPVDRRVKIGFVLVFLAVAGVVVYLQLRPARPKGQWLEDLDKAFAQARAASPAKKVVVLVQGSPPSYEDGQMTKGTLSKVPILRALEQFVTVRLTLDADAPWAKTYGVTRTPTMLVVSPDGRTFHRREGFINETDFLTQFLKAELKQPAAPGP